MNVEHFWPDVPERAFTILRQIAQEVQRQTAEAREYAMVSTPADFAESAVVLTREWLDRKHEREAIVQAAALLVRAIDGIDERAAGKIDASVSEDYVMTADITEILRRGAPDQIIRCAEVINVIRVVTVHGRGIDGDPVREVTSYWTIDGMQIAQHDPCAGSSRD